MLPLIISFYTNDWQYPAHAQRLREECAALGLECRIEERPSAGGYLQNTCIKPLFIRDMLRREKRPVLWIDVDGSIYKRPCFFEGIDVDFAAKKMAAGRTRTWHVGTMYFAYNKRTLSFVDRWCDLAGALSDESALDELWREAPGLTTSDIPESYFVLGVKGALPDEATVIYHRVSTGESKQAQRHLFAKDKPQTVRRCSRGR